MTTVPPAAITIEPDTAESAAAALHAAAANRQTVLIRGAGTKIGWGRSTSDVGLVISTRRLNRLLGHQHGDLTATIEAGAALADVNSALGRHRQWLPLDPPNADRATIGGLLATNDSGPLRHRYGAPRDLVIGVQLALPDGSLPRAGGQVVKNVAGYDLAKLIAGSFGSLALIVSATFKLAPLPPASKTLRIFTDDAIGPVVAAVMRSQVDPIAFDLHVSRTRGADRTRAEQSVLVRFGTVPAAVDAQIDQVRRLPAVAALPTETVDGDAERAAWREHHDRFWAADGAIVRVNWRPALVDDVVAVVERCAADAHADVDLAGRAALGAGVLRIGGDDEAQGATIARLRASPLLSHVVVVRGSEALKSRVGVWGELGDNARLFAALKRAFDPDGILNAGRGPL